MRSWELRCVELDRPYNTNQERKDTKWDRAEMMTAWRETFYILTRKAKVPKLRRASFTITPTYPNGRSLPDTGACAPSAKAAIDGIVEDAKVLVNDSGKYVPSITFMAPLIVAGSPPGLTVIIEEQP